MKRVICIISGTTGSGKNDLAYKIYKRLSSKNLKTKIINFDTQQMKRGLSIIKRTPDKNELKQFKLHMYNVLPANASINVFEYEQLIKPLISDGINLLVGGSPFFLKYMITNKLTVKTPNEIKLHRDIKTIKNKLLDDGVLKPSLSKGVLYDYDVAVILLSNKQQLFNATIQLLQAVSKNAKKIKRELNSDYVDNNIIGIDYIKLFINHKIEFNECLNRVFVDTYKYHKYQTKFFKQIIKQYMHKKPIIYNLKHNHKRCISKNITRLLTSAAISS